MPRDSIPITSKLEKLSILAPDGTVDKKLDPRLPDSDLRKLYKYMLFARILDERCLHLQRQGRMGTYGPCRGQEAVGTAVAYCLTADDWLVPSYRELPAFLWRGWPLDRYLLWWGGHEIGSCIPEGVNDLPICVPIASQCQYAAGIAWGMKLRKHKHVVACFCGDGGTSEGDFHESLNWASVFKVPLVMVVQNNHWAISVPLRRQMACQTIAQRAVAYGMDAMQVDGNDVLAVVTAVKEAVEKARAGGGPSLIEAVTYRVWMHTTADDPKKYRSQEEVAAWEAKDPIARFRTYLKDRKLLTETVEREIEQEIREEIDSAIKAYETYRHDPYEFFHYMYSEMTPELKKQLAELRDYLENASGSGAPAGGAAVAAH